MRSVNCSWTMLKIPFLHQVAGVCGCLVQEAGDGVVDLRLGAAAGPVLGQGRCQQ